MEAWDVAIGTNQTSFRANELVGDGIITSLLWTDHDGAHGEPADVDMSEVPHTVRWQQISQPGADAPLKAARRADALPDVLGDHRLPVVG